LTFIDFPPLSCPYGFYIFFSLINFHLYITIFVKDLTLQGGMTFFPKTSRQLEALEDSVIFIFHYYHTIDSALL